MEMCEKREEYKYQTSLNSDVRKEKTNFSTQQLELRNSKCNRHGTENGANNKNVFENSELKETDLTSGNELCSYPKRLRPHSVLAAASAEHILFVYLASK
ncbi:hypothetical protein BC937DRAFT_90071 [Endogone sp. FLAS-F59071]|nr:hypothetical protein BC937DRAFT_90071 [Endogone sp. FLAS-F59071]|eukprot:RUS17362.1 hypothetical protein BC937DRAFT_90071 [Endogone sp. FLAS-F59071]